MSYIANFDRIFDWILKNQLKCVTLKSRPTYSILLAQLMATVIHYPFIVALPGLAYESAFLEDIYKIWTLDSGLGSGLDHGLTAIQALIN